MIHTNTTEASSQASTEKVNAYRGADPNRRSVTIIKLLTQVTPRVLSGYEAVDLSGQGPCAIVTRLALKVLNYFGIDAEVLQVEPRLHSRPHDEELWLAKGRPTDQQVQGWIQPGDKAVHIGWHLVALVRGLEQPWIVDLTIDQAERAGTLSSLPPVCCTVSPVFLEEKESHVIRLSSGVVLAYRRLSKESCMLYKHNPVWSEAPVDRQIIGLIIRGIKTSLRELQTDVTTH